MPRFPASIPAVKRPAVGAVSRSADKLDIFAVADDGNVWTAAWEPDFGAQWRGWYVIGGAAFQPGTPVTAVSRSADKLDIFAVDFLGNILTAAWQPGFSQWGPWLQVAGGTTVPGAPVGAVSRSPDKLDVFVVGDDGLSYTAAWEPDFGPDWRGWWPIQFSPEAFSPFPPGGAIHAVSRSTDKLDIFAVAKGNLIVTSAWEPGFTQWSPWRQVANGLAEPGADVTAISRSTDKLDVFVVSPFMRQPHGGFPGEEGLVFTAAWEPGPDDWRGWWTAFTDPLATFSSDGVAIGAVSRSRDKIDIFAAGAVIPPEGNPGYGGVVTSAWPQSDPDVRWLWKLVAGGIGDIAGPALEFMPPVTAVSRNTDKMDIFFVGSDENIWTAAWEPDFGEFWGRWRTVGS